MIYNDAKVLKIAPFFKDELNDFNNISSIYWYIHETVNYLVCMSRVEFLFFMNEASLYKAKIWCKRLFYKKGVPNFVCTRIFITY